MPTVTDSAEGASHSTGDAQIATRLAGVATSAGSSQSTGDAQIQTSLPLAAMSDIGIWDPTGVDPAISCLLKTVSGLDSRAAVSATAPVPYITALSTLWNGSVNAAVRAVYEGTASTFTSCAITAVQLEAVNLGNQLPPDAADFRDRLVYNGTYLGTTVSRSQDRALTGTWSGKMVNAGTNPNNISIHPTYGMYPTELAVAPVAPGDVVYATINLALPRTGAQWLLLMYYFTSNFSTVSTYVTSVATHPGGYTWQSQTGFTGVPSGVAYVAVAPLIIANAAADGEIAYADCQRLISTVPSVAVAPTPFTPARQQNITVAANRINEVYNPSFATNTSGWTIAGGGSGTTFTQDPTMGVAAPGSAKTVAVYSGGSTAPSVSTLSAIGNRGMAILIPGQTYTCSVYGQVTAGQPALHLQAQIDGVNYPGTTTLTAPEDPANVFNGFMRLSVTVTVPITSSGVLALNVFVAQADWAAYAQNMTFWLDDALVERSPLLGDYFDAELPSPDYVWEGAAFLSRSHYYRDYRNLQYRLSELVGQCTPLQRPYQLLYAQPGT